MAMTTYNMRTRRKLLTEDAKRLSDECANRAKVRESARAMCRCSSLINERDALRLAEAGFGWEDVRGSRWSPRVSDTLAKQLVLGIT